MRIFIVENHRDTLDSLQAFFEDLGHTVQSATTLAEAAAALREANPDLLLCDIGLPDGTGWELLEKVQLGSRVLTVAMSGFGMNADNVRSRAAGFHHHLVKPIKLAELDRILEEASARAAG